MSFKNDTAERLARLYEKRRGLVATLRNVNSKINEIEQLAPTIASDVTDAAPADKTFDAIVAIFGDLLPELQDG